jgi:hypothetical protein
LHEDAPAVAENVPAVHAVHETLALVGWYVPTPQFKHALAPEAEYVAAGHTTHAEAPVVLAKVPAAHGVQLPAPAPA